MKALRAAVMLACLFALAGCLPVTSKTPVGTTAGLGADPALIGTWKGTMRDKDDKGAGTPMVLTVRPLPQALDAVLASPGNKDGDVMHMRAKTTALGPNRFIDVTAFDDTKPGEPPQDTLKGKSFAVLYTIHRGRLTLSLLDEAAAKALVNKGVLAGRIEQGAFGDVVITADGAALDAFMARPEAAKLFQVFVVLRKTE